jgi:hypothetical protein
MTAAFTLMALLCGADDVELIKEEMAAIRKELVQVRMELRRIDARKASEAALAKLDDPPEAGPALGKMQALYWTALRERLEKDLADLRDQLKKAGG